MLKLFQEWREGNKGKCGGGEFNYDILEELLQMSQYTPSIAVTKNI
jgi:hypothetical protein